MIFVTLGSQKFQFNRLLKALDELVEENVITDKVFAQIGYSDYRPKNYQYTEFLDMDEFNKAISECDIFITHGGTGAIINAVKRGKKVLAIPRLKKYGEHVDDHQIQILKQFEGMKIIEACYNLDELGEKYKKIQYMEFSPYRSNTEKIIESIRSFIEN